MPVAAVVHLEALADGHVEGGFGRAIHSLWNDHLAQVAPQVGQQLQHQAQTQPFALSDLMGLQASPSGEICIVAGDRAWFRVAVLEDSLAAVLTGNWLPGLLGQPTKLAGIPWAVLAHSAIPEQHPWATRESYDSIWRHAQSRATSIDNWQFRFRSPTTFHAGRKTHLPFPLPDSLIKSWLRRWNAFNDIEQLWQWLPHWRKSLVVSGYSLRTVPVRYGRQLRIGCVGWYGLRALNLPPDERAIINALADYAFYCGSGHHTTQGMGLTRRQST
ncbi:MAG: CRISPR system precrRNA processing endoribonuclease RAMP protein Cas6 [Candidatus Promineofilum sp.]|nr:CRISPR system precrRNA processing endoribonuclease RAMP protein Cas6 [Promineifilum sp.]